MKSLFFKSLTAILLIVVLCSLTACGGGGGGGNSAGNSGSGDNGNSIINNQTLQATAVSNVISRLRNNIANLFPLSSIRSNINNSYRTSVFPNDLWEKNVETHTGKVLLNIAKIEIPETDYDVEEVLDSSLDSFKKRFSNDSIIYTDSKMVVAKSGEYNIGLSIDKDGDTQMKTYFVTYGTQSDDVIGVSFLKNHDYATFPFRMETSQGELCIVGYIYIGAQMYRGFQAGGSSETLAHIFGIGTKEFDYENYQTHESTTYDYSGNALKDVTD